MRDIVLLRFRENYNVVNVRIAQFSDFLSKDFINCPLTYARRILKTKWESAKFKLYVANGKGRLFPFFLSQDFMAKVVKYWALPMYDSVTELVGSDACHLQFVSTIFECL